MKKLLITMLIVSMICLNITSNVLAKEVSTDRYINTVSHTEDTSKLCNYNIIA